MSTTQTLDIRKPDERLERMKVFARNVVVLAVIALNVAAICFGANVPPNLVIVLCFAGYILST